MWGYAIPIRSSELVILNGRKAQYSEGMETHPAPRQHGASPKADIEALWRRVVFHILIFQYR